jgi:hypothetical protein
MAVIRSSASTTKAHRSRRAESGKTLARAKAARPAQDPVTYSHRPTRARKIENAPHDEFNSTGAKPANPCALVIPSEAHAIVGRPIVRAWRAPQGPTCIYQVRGTKNYITLVVQRGKLATVRKHARTLSRRNMRGRTIYCLKLGSTMTLVPLSGSRLLQIGASCSIGSQLAAKALTRL